MQFKWWVHLAPGLLLQDNIFRTNFVGKSEKHSELLLSRRNQPICSSQDDKMILLACSDIWTKGTKEKQLFNHLPWYKDMHIKVEMIKLGLWHRQDKAGGSTAIKNILHSPWLSCILVSLCQCLRWSDAYLVIKYQDFHCGSLYTSLKNTNSKIFC